MDIEVIEQEIAPKGKAYVRIKKGPLEGLEDLWAGLREKGARQIFVASRDSGEPLDAVPGLVHAHDMLGLTCPLDGGRPRPKGLLTLEPLTWEKKDLFLRIYGESFFQVPNSATYDDADFAQIMGPEYRCGFALLDGATVGIYELGFKKEHPEIGSIGLDGAYVGRGLGRELLLTLMDYLAQLGHTACWLQVSTANENAHGLYRWAGFGQDEVLGRWFEVTHG